MPGTRQKLPLHKTEIFRTGQVAMVCRVSPRTVTGWIDTGQLRGYALPPKDPRTRGSGDRRVTRKALIEFMELFSIPTDLLLAPQLATAAVSSSTKRKKNMAELQETLRSSSVAS